MKKILSFILASLLFFTALPFTADAKTRFTDVNEGAWYYDAVNYASETGLMSGVSEDRFDPNGKMTRAMMVTVLGRRAGADVSKYTKSSFKDVKAAWALPYIEWAKENKIVSGTSATTFSPDAPATREQMATFLFNYAKYAKLPNTQGMDQNAVDRFIDSLDISGYAYEPLNWAAYFGIINGTGTHDGDVTLSPKGLTTRAQFAQVMMGFDGTRFDLTTPIGQILINGNDIKDYSIIYNTTHVGDNGEDEGPEEGAELLRKYIKKAVGADLPVYLDSEKDIDPEGKEILLGITNREGAEGGIEPIDHEQYTNHAFEVKTEGNRLIIVSSERKGGTLLGAYHVVEEIIGWNIYNIGDYIKKSKDKIEIPEGYSYKGDAAIQRTEVVWYSIHAGDEGGPFYNEAADNYEWGGRFITGEYDVIHQDSDMSINNFATTLMFMSHDWHNEDGSIMSPDEIMTKLYELYDNNLNLVDDPCLSDDKVIENIIICAKAMIQQKANRGKDLLYLSPGDGQYVCKCDKCMAVYREEHAYSGTYINMIEKVADAIKDEYPNIRIQFNAYRNTLSAPMKTNKLRDNVQVQFVTFTYCAAHAIDNPNCEKNRRVREAFERWYEIADGRVLIYDHFALPYNSFAIQGNLITCMHNLAYWAKFDLRGALIEAQRSPFSNEAGEMWRQYLKYEYTDFEDYDKALNTYLKARYGYGWTYIREFIDTVCEANEKEEYPVCTRAPEIQFSKENYFENKYYLNSLLKKAMDLTSTSFQKICVEQLTLQMDYEELLYTYDSKYTYGSDAERQQYSKDCNDFIKKVYRLGWNTCLVGEAGRHGYSGVNPDTGLWDGTDPAIWGSNK